MRAAFLSCLVFTVPVLGQEKKPDKITPENIEVGKVGTIDRLEVEKVLDVDSKLIIANFGTLRLQVDGYPAKGIGRGKILPADQLWRVDYIVKEDQTGNGLKGCYAIKPVEWKKEKK